MPDIDSGDRNDPLACALYVQDIYEYYHRVEETQRVSPNYMAERQRDINSKMRGILIDWIAEVHLKFKLMPETLFLTVNLIDRYLQKVEVSRKRLQLVGVAAMLIASKYEEIWAPEVRDFISISDKTYTREQILAMERHMLNVVGWALTVPSTYIFLSRYLKAAGCYNDKQIALTTAYIGELALVDYKMLKYKHSEIAAAAVYIARKAADQVDTYPYALQKHSGYRLENIKPCIKDILKLMANAGNYKTASFTKAVHRKYSTSKFRQVAAAKVPDVNI